MTTTIDKLLTECDEQYGFSSWPEERLVHFKSLPEALLTKIWLDLDIDHQDLRELHPEQILALPLSEILPEDLDAKTKMIESYQAALKALGTIDIVGINVDGDLIYKSTPFTFKEDLKLIEMRKAGRDDTEVAMIIHRSLKSVRERIKWLENCSLETVEQLKQYHERTKADGRQEA